MEQVKNALDIYQERSALNVEFLDVHGSRVSKVPPVGSTSHMVWCLCEQGLQQGWTQSDVKREAKRLGGMDKLSTHAIIWRWATLTGKRLAPVHRSREA